MGGSLPRPACGFFARADRHCYSPVINASTGRPRTTCRDRRSRRPQGEYPSIRARTLGVVGPEALDVPGAVAARASPLTVRPAIAWAARVERGEHQAAGAVSGARQRVGRCAATVRNCCDPLPRSLSVRSIRSASISSGRGHMTYADLTACPSCPEGQRWTVRPGTSASRDRYVAGPRRLDPRILHRWRWNSGVPHSS